jgi:fimbrial isopeptide formation D2 family protein
MASRGLWHFMGRRTRRGLALSWSALFVLSLLLQYFTFALAPAALAVHDESLFELDGNATDSAATEPDDDWDSLNHALADVHIGASSESAANDTTYFTGGGSKDVNDVSQWNYTANDQTPDKDDILDAFAAAYEKNGDTFVYFGADRFDGSGDSFVGFWFFQNNIGLGANGNFSGVHKNGDILVLSDFTNGGSVAEIKIYEWLNGGLSLKESGAGCDLPGDEQACAVVNGGVVGSPWTFTDKDGNHSFQAGEFYEGGINLDTVFGGDAPCFSGFLAETRSSQSTSAQLKDFALGNFDTCVPPTITTDASVSTFHFGDAAVTDSATLAGSDGPASGKVKFFVCDPSEISGTGCPSGGTQVGAAAGVTVNTTANGGTATSAGFTPTAAGKYCFRAEYVPDAASQYLAGSHTNATNECFTAVKNPTTITTAADQTVSVGAAITDSATLSGATSDAGGTIVFKAYGPADTDCSNAAAFTSSAFPVSGNGTYGPASFIPASAGTYHWIATYSGDAKNVASHGDCGDAGENDTVGKLNPTVTTVASAGVIVGGKIHDTATLAGAHEPTSGSITFNLYGPDNATCTGAALFTDTVAVTGNGDYVSGDFTATTAGTYRWIANYGGDANNNATTNGCNAANENVIVSKTTPSISTSLVSGNTIGANISVALGASVHDTSTLTGATANAGGTVHYRVFSNAACTTLFADAGTIAVVNGDPGDSSSVAFNQAGIYYWQADYSGDANNSAAAGDCTEETVSVGLNSPTISTNASASVLVGGQIHDTATLAGGFSPTGSITFRLYGPNDATCVTAPIFTSVVTVNGNGDYVSDAFTTAAAGTYRWVATYGGDANNAVAAGSCNDANENVAVTTPNLDVVKLVATGAGAFGPTSVATPGDVLNFQITVTNSGNGVATDVPVSDNIAPLLAHATYNDDCNLSCNLVGSTLNWTIASIAPNGGSATLTFSVTLSDTFPTGTTHLPNVVVVTGPGSNCAAGSEDADCDTDTTVATSILTIDKDVAGNTGGTFNDPTDPTNPLNGLKQAKIGDTLTYSLHYVGAGPLTHAVITDPIPEGLAYVAGSAAGDTNFDAGVYDTATRTITWNQSDPAVELPDPAEGTLTFKVTVLAAAADIGIVDNVATIISDQTPLDEGEVAVGVLPPPLGLTPPPTDTITPQTASSNPGFALMLILLGVAGLTLGIGFMTPAPARVRRRDRLG